MKDVTKKVVILDNLASPYVHQAIIVMRDYNPKLESRAIIEAERIVNSYLDNMKTRESRLHRPARKKNHALLYTIIAFIAAAAAIAIYLKI